MLAFDIECEKSPLKFPNPDRDRIYMISYMISGGPGEPPQGYLIISKEIVSEDIDNFEYTPLPKFPGPFHVFNEQNEEGLMRRFVDHVKELKPHVMVTYNGDGFDWPYVEARAKLFNLSVYKEFGMKSASGSGGESKVLASDNEYLGRCVVHLDAFKWVQRDSYLPQGNQGLKSVTKAKLGYDPVEVDPEDMVRYAIEKPAHMASYSVSDAVATYYLYQLYVHNFIFSLCTILPMQSEDVLRKGSGTLCEALLMVEAYRLNIMCPNKQMDNLEKFHNGHLLESETYIGGHVECIEAGVFRSDIPVQFKIVPSAVQSLIDNIDRDLTFAIETENGMQRSDVVNYDDVKQEIVEKLEELRDSPDRNETPFIYHLDVGAMYPNIILTNRLQPSAIVTPSDCASCEYNRAENNCKRPMTWTWRGDYIPASIGEYQNIKRQLTFERFPVEPDQIGYKSNGATTKSFSELSEKAQATKIKERLKTYSQRVYRKSKITEVSERVDTVCMRENPFYVNTVRSFRDRRYDYKLLTKQWKGKKAAAEKSGDVLSKRQAEDMEILMDSLQLAHKCILNSFYGYVMRKGARWRSMEMAGLVTHTGAGLIKQARELVEQIGRPLELDTDGIWAAIPSSFPSDFKLLLRNGGKINFAYPCAMLNADVHDQYTNSQYQNLIVDSEGNSGSGAAKQFATHAECSIYFELDGPYKAMILPASPEEGRLLKKKYVVFNYDNSVAELKGFEIKRRGELEMVKIFQSQVFDKFLAGKTLQDSYDAVGAVANKWLDILDTCGMNVPVDEMLELISEKKTISKTLDDYSGRKATSLTTATRLADFLGAEMAKDKGLNCNLIISKYPRNAPVTDRAIPVAIFAAEESVRKYYLRKWLKEPHLECEDFREVVDWDYYKERISRTIQKIITVPAGIQSIQNPCPRVEHPPWLQKILSDKLSKTKQVRINTLFKPGMIDKQPKHVVGSLGTSESQSMVDSPTKKRVFSHSSAVMDIEDLMDPNASLGLNKSKTVLSRHKVKFSGDEYIATEGNADDGCGTLSNAEADMDTGGDDEHSPSADANEKDMMDVESTVSPMMIQAPSTKEEMLAWLNTRKAQWKKERDLLKQARGLRNGSGQGKQYGKSIKDVLRGSGAVGYYNENDASKNKRVMSVADLVRNATLSVTQGYWQIIELCPSETPGEFIVYAMTQRAQMQKLFLTVPRYMYFNCRKSDAADFAKALGGRNVVKDLPHSHKIGSCGLYEIALSERKFIRNDKQLSSLSNSSSVEGVYETLTPLWLRSVLQIGCITRLSNGHSSTSSSTHFNLEDLEFISSKDFPYMNIRTAQYRKIYLYAITEKTKNSNPLGGIGLFILDDLYEDVDTEAFDTAKISGKAYVWLINTGLTSYAAQQQPRPPMHKIYRKHYAAQHYSNGHLGNPFANNEDMKFNTRFVNSVSDAWQMCSEKLENYMRERHGPTVVFVQGSVGDINTKSWRKICPVLHDMPVVLMPHNSTDEYFPLTWQMFVAERMIQRLFILPTWLEDRLQSANYCHVPLANLGRDVTMTMIDVLFARQLKVSAH